jgi:hypothetical protein
MIIKGVKPRTHLKLDIFLFVLLVVMAISALVAHTVSPDEAHIQFMFHRIHGWSGILMCVTVSVHLLLHIPWIRSQLSRWLKR